MPVVENGKRVAEEASASAIISVSTSVYRRIIETVSTNEFAVQSHIVVYVCLW